MAAICSFTKDFVVVLCMFVCVWGGVLFTFIFFKKINCLVGFHEVHRQNINLFDKSKV